MMIRIFKSKKAQSVLEYILVSAAFATAGIATFVAMSRASVLSHRGLSADYTTNSTLTGQVITASNSTVTEQQKWQEPTTEITNWTQPEPLIDNRVTTQLVADSETHNSTWTQTNEDQYVDTEAWRQEIPDQSTQTEPGCQGPGCAGS